MPGILRTTVLSVVIICLLYWSRYITQQPPQLQVHYADSARGHPQYLQDPLVDTPVASAAAALSASSLPITPTSSKSSADLPIVSQHPIEYLIQHGEAEFQRLLSQQTYDVSSAAAAYRQRRGRHPPPGFDLWYEFAKQNNVVVVEEFWDQIYHDLGPFWGIPPEQIRLEARDFEMTINVRGGKASAGSDWFWTQIWLNLIQTIEAYLPDMDLALNAMDEPRLVVPWEDINSYMEKERASRRLVPHDEVITEFTGFVDDLSSHARDKEWESTQPYWKVASRGCPPTSPARKAGVVEDLSHGPHIDMRFAQAHSYQGYVSNFSLSAEICHQPDMQYLHGALIRPLTVAASKKLFPMFGGSKFHTNNEILLPAPMYWNNEERFSGGDDHGLPWDQKTTAAIWRGVATGGKNTPYNWLGFQRHRFVAMTNASKISALEHMNALPTNFEIPGPEYNLAAAPANHLGDWVQTWSNTGFVDLFCEDPQPDAHCFYTDPYYEVLPGMPMAQQFSNKYIPDIDGNSFSGRYRGFLLSTSLPIKSTLFKEWHDSRLVPWVHFVPMDNRYEDFFGIMQYFLGYDGARFGDSANATPGHDDAAKRIADAGQEWAQKVLRREDMQVYVLRLLLEYARVSDDKREKLGWVGDLRTHEGPKVVPKGPA